ncbi:AzlC family ABC transporter permease [Desulforamulus hydrothermalis]|uniref:AzlC family protein n=1 Tax=Desulforamulus hydrothermalis Lam5 = DSM 18033 TaxID=1121428 RepID=K8DYI0_9FIRM|nr:AzlC family ABC transporter permease [Desulforamulus hydrothermalis]CCO07932.1 AzlC family protein [Desulforamulus hydrothermalis Lam5 = DSM 18033]SHG85961.1 4-azaleucine resistance probable transporter AzlC [Desulforamulus hydrothermalis Lam5 = DSM 18033]
MQLSNLLSGKSETALEVWEAIRDCAPVVFGAVPFGITCGIMGLTAKMSAGEIILMSVFVFAGASQFIGITMLGAGITSWGIVVFTTLLVNLRHLIMGMSLAPYMTRLPLSLQAFLAFFLTDETYALTVSRLHKAAYSMVYQLTVSILLYLAWVLSTIGGVVLGSYISDPLTWGLDFAMPATFLVLLVPLLTSRTGLIVCGVAAVVSVIAALYLPGKWYIIIACLTASIIGGLLEEEN